MDDAYHESDQTEARAFRVVQAPDAGEYVFEWQIVDGTIMTVTSIKISRAGLLQTADTLTFVAAQIRASAQSAGEKP